MADSKIPITNPEYRESIIEQTNALQSVTGRNIAPRMPAAAITGGDNVSHGELAAQIDNLAKAVDDLRSGLGAKTQKEDVKWATFPTSGGSKQFDLPNEGGASEIVFNFIEGSVTQDGVVKGTFSRLFEPARFVQLTTSHSCKVAVNTRATGVMDFSVSASPMSLENVEISKLIITFNTTLIKLSMVSNTALTSMTVSRAIPVVLGGQMQVKHGINAQSTGVDASTDNAVTLSASADNGVWSGANNTYDLTWGENERFAGFHLHSVEGGTPDVGISEEFGWQHRPSAGGLTGSLASWSSWFYRNSVVDCVDFSWYPASSFVFETNATIRFNITAQNYTRYTSDTAYVYPTVFVEEL
tara:strand:+ start:1847 stop:2914 length:1068 start_codon:yes stop_codon:yes gene_type:complete